MGLLYNNLYTSDIHMQSTMFDFIYNNLYTSYIHMQSTMFDFFKSYIVVACDNYFKTIINVSLKQ
jgi:hypothetical protein